MRRSFAILLAAGLLLVGSLALATGALVGRVERARAFGWNAIEIDGHYVEEFDRAYKDCLLVAVTEKRTKDEIDAYAAALAAAVA